MVSIVIMAEIGNQAGKVPWPSLEWASWLFDRASFVLIGSLIVGAAATAIIVWMGIVKQHYWDLAREAASKKIAELNNQTELLRSKNLEMQAHLAPRSLSREQFQEIQSLKGHITAINLAVEADSESKMFAGVLSAALMSAGIRVRMYLLPPAMQGPGGLVIYDQGIFDVLSKGTVNPGKLIFDVFSKAKIAKMGMSSQLPINVALPPDTPAIFVYEKSMSPNLSMPHLAPAKAETNKNG